MKSKIKFHNLELTVISKRNKVVSYEGSDVLKTLVESHFKQSVGVVRCETSKIGIRGQIVKELKPGQKDYIRAVLINVIQNELGMEVEFRRSRI